MCWVTKSLDLEILEVTGHGPTLDILKVDILCSTELSIVKRIKENEHN